MGQSDKPGKKQESVWDYPRPPRVEQTDEHIRITFNGVVIAETTRAFRVLETSHPPTYYIPPDDVQMVYLQPTRRQTVCEFKGRAAYWTVQINERSTENAAWSYPEPREGYEAIRDYLCFYPSKMDRCEVDGDVVTAQEGDFYGGWITSNITGPFKGGPGTMGW